MCGIAGIVDLRGRDDRRAETLERMCETMVCRGPDDSAIYTGAGMGVGFRRLSIVDLSKGANQPFFNEDRSILCVCNGEIFNHRLLREELQAKGHELRTECDVEVLVHLYEEHREGLLDKLNGQFAFAIHDSTTGEWLLARDHVGIAPLFYTVAAGVLIFASEIKAILQHPWVRREVNLTGLDQMLCFPGLVSPTTMFAGISALPPGHFARVRGGELEVRKYWDLVYPEEERRPERRPEADYIDRLDELLLRAVRLRLNADVPVGAYVSGGMDSALIACMMARLEPGRRWDTFSIGFEQASIDERAHQRLVVSQIGSTHHETVFDDAQVVERLAQAVLRAETPLKESYDTCSLALSEMVSRSGIKVVLTGEGADELFAGYVGYRIDAHRGGFAADPLDVEEMLDAEIRQRLWGDAGFFYERNQVAFRETRAALYAPQVREKLGAFDCLEAPLVDLGMLAGRHPIHKRSYVDFKLRLSDHLLADHGDRVSYANSVEARYPFLDRDVVELAATIPPDLLLRDGLEKFVLRRVAKRYVPEGILQREKFAFVAPGSPYLIGSHRSWAEELISSDAIRRAGYFDPDTVERLKRMYREPGFTVNQTFDNDLLLCVLTFQLFLRVFEMPSLGGD